MYPTRNRTSGPSLFDRVLILVLGFEGRPRVYGILDAGSTVIFDIIATVSLQR